MSSETDPLDVLRKKKQPGVEPEVPKVSRGALSRGITPTQLSTAIRWDLFTRHGWMSTQW